jgi:hypothetical protein
MSSGTLAELSYEAAVRALDLQERGVEQLRAAKPRRELVVL